MRRLIFVIPLFFIGCSTLTITDKCERLKLSIKDNEFYTFFELSKRKDTINVFTSDYFTSCHTVKISSDKIILLRHYQGDYDVNDINRNRSFKEILLYNYEEDTINNTFVFYFIYTGSNGTLKMTYDLKGNLIRTQKGAF